MGAKQRKVVMQFDVFGQVKLDAEGFVGNSCKDATKNYLAALSPGSKDDSTKPEFFQPNAQSATVGSRW